MENILKDINAVVGVTGCFVCNGEGQVLASALPNLFNQTILSTVGRIMAQTMAGLATARRRKVGDMDLLYREGRLVIKNLREGCLCILCVRHINVPLLNLTANVAARKLIERIKKSEGSRKQQAAAKVPLPAGVSEAAVKIWGEAGRALLQAPPQYAVKASFFAGLEQELTKVIGPLASLVISREIKALGESRESFPLGKVIILLEQVGDQIDGEAKQLQFQQAMQKPLKALLD
jgi:hypothetical protein